MRIRVEEVFDAATALPGHDRCAGLHGHTYTVEAVVQGAIRGGVLEDFRAVRERLREVVAPLDHTDLSLKFPYPSCEVLALDICARLKAVQPGLELVRLWEGEGKWVELKAAEIGEAVR